ncbi:unnamed protein product, partial [Mesorhabditis spiculigera]
MLTDGWILALIVDGQELVKGLAHVTPRARNDNSHCGLCGIFQEPAKLRGYGLWTHGNGTKKLCGGCRHRLDKHLPNEPCHDSFVCRSCRLCDWDGSGVAIDRSCGACLWQRAIELKIVDPTAVEGEKKGAQGKKHRRSLPVDPLKVKPKRRQLKKRAG